MHQTVKLSLSPGSYINAVYVRVSASNNLKHAHFYLCLQFVGLVVIRLVYLCNTTFMDKRNGRANLVLEVDKNWSKHLLNYIFKNPQCLYKATVYMYLDFDLMLDTSNQPTVAITIIKLDGKCH